MTPDEVAHIDAVIEGINAMRARIVALEHDLEQARHEAQGWEDKAHALQRRLYLVTGLRDQDPF